MVKFKIDSLLWVIYLGSFVSDNNESYLSSFLANYLAQNFNIVEESFVGLIFAINNLGQFLANIFLGFLLKKGWIKKRTLIIVGFLMQITSSVMFWILNSLDKDADNKVTVLIISITSRIINGLGIGITTTIFFAFIPLYYPREVEEKVSGVEIASGVGLCLGPLLGGLSYEQGYYLPFLYSIVTTVLVIPLVYFYLEKRRLHKRLVEVKKAQPIIDLHIKEGSQLKEPFFESTFEEQNDLQIQDGMKDTSEFSQSSSVHGEVQNEVIKEEEQGGEEEGEEEEEQQEVVDDPRFGSITHSLLKLQIFLPYLFIVIANSLLFFLDPTLSVFMEDTYQKKAGYSGFIIAMKDFVYVLACPLCTYVMLKFPSYKLLATGGGIMMGLSMFLFGPDHLLTRLPPSEYFAIAASVLNGTASVFVFLPAIQIMIDNLKVIYQDDINEEQVGEISSMLFNSAFSLGGFIGPLIAGVMVDAFDSFIKASSLFGLIIITYTIIYLVLSRKPDPEISNQRQEAIQQKLSVISEHEPQQNDLDSIPNN